jgi:hypothetical protein
MKRFIIALVLVLAVLFVSACSTSRDVRYSRRDRDRNGIVIGQGSRDVDDNGVVIRKHHRRHRDRNLNNDDQVVVKKKTIKDDNGDVIVKTRRERKRDLD